MAISHYRGTATIELRKRFPELRGSMMAIGCSKEEVVPLIEQISTKGAICGIACYNSPNSLTISGDEPAIDQLQAVLQEKQIFNRKLQVGVAYHSHHMKLVAKTYLECLQSLEGPKSSDVRFHSSLLGKLLDGSKLEPSYWVDNMTESVQFSEAVMSMCKPVDGHKTGVNMIVEIGPHSALAGPTKQILKACGPNAMKIPYISALVRNTDAVESAQSLASALFVKGVTLDLGAINFPRSTKEPSLLVDIPRYPWNHQTRYWHESRMMQKHKNRTTPRNDLLGKLANYSNDLEPTWRNILRIDDLPWLRHHKIQSLTLFPMSGFIAMALEAASQKANLRNVHYDKFELREVSVETPLMIDDDDVETTLQLRPHHEGTLTSSDVWDEFRIHSWTTSKGWTEHCKGLISVTSKGCNNVDSSRLAQESASMLRSTVIEMVTSRMHSVDKTKIYESLSELGVSYGAIFQGMNDCQASDRCSMATIVAEDTSLDMPQGYQTSMIIHPAMLEQLIEMYWPILGAGRTSINTIYLPSSVQRMTISRNISDLTKAPGSSLQAFCKSTPPLLHPKPISVSTFATVTSDSTEAVIMLDALVVSPLLERESSSESETYRELCYKLDWEPILQPLNHSVSNGVSNGIPEHSNVDWPLSSLVSGGISNGVSQHLNGASHHVSGASQHINGAAKHFYTASENSNGTTKKPLGDISNGVSQTTAELQAPDEEMAIIHGDSMYQRRLALKLADALSQLTGKMPDIGSLIDIRLRRSFAYLFRRLTNLFYHQSHALMLLHFRNCSRKFGVFFGL